MERLRLGIVSRTATYWPFYIAQEEGYFARHELDAELTVLGTTSAGVPALLERHVDVAATCPDVLVVRATEGAPLRVAGGLINLPVSSLMAAPDISDFAGLKGRRVAVTEQRGSVSIFLRALLREKGLASADYEQVVCSTSPEQVAALEQGRVDAAMLTHPFESRLLGRGFRRLARVGDVLGPCAFTALNVCQGWTRKAAWPRLREAMRDAAVFLNDSEHKQQACAILAEATGVGAAELNETYDLYAGASAVLAQAGELDLSGFERLLRFMGEDGIGSNLGPAQRYLDEQAALR